MKIGELLAGGRFASNAVDGRNTELRQTRVSKALEGGIWLADPGGGEFGSDVWVQPLAVPLTHASGVGCTTPHVSAAPAGSIVCLGDLDVAGAADLAAQGGITRLVTRLARSLRRAEADVVVTSLGLDCWPCKLSRTVGHPMQFLRPKPRSWGWNPSA